MDYPNLTDGYDHIFIAPLMAARWWYWPTHRATTMVRSDL